LVLTALATHFDIHRSDMHKPNTNCNELLASTAAVLNGPALRLLLLSAQRNDVEFCIEQVIKEKIIPNAQSEETYCLWNSGHISVLLAALERGLFSQEEQKNLLRDVMACFPHSLVRITKHPISC